MQIVLGAIRWTRNCLSSGTLLFNFLGVFKYLLALCTSHLYFWVCLLLILFQNFFFLLCFVLRQSCLWIRMPYTYYSSSSVSWVLELQAFAIPGLGFSLVYFSIMFLFSLSLLPLSLSLKGCQRVFSTVQGTWKVLFSPSKSSAI